MPTSFACSVAVRDKIEAKAGSTGASEAGRERRREESYRYMFVMVDSNP